MEFSYLKVRSLALLLFLSLVAQEALAQRYRTKNETYRVIELGSVYLNGITVEDRYGGTYKKPNTFTPFFLEVGTFKIKRSKKVYTGRRREIIKLKRPVMIGYSASLLYGKSSNKLDNDSFLTWKGFDDRRMGFYLQFKGGYQLLEKDKSSLYWIFTPTFLSEQYKTQALYTISRYGQQTTFFGIGLGAELLFLKNLNSDKLLKFAIGTGPLGYNYYSSKDNNPFIQEDQRRIRSAESRLSPYMLILKVGMAFPK